MPILPRAKLRREQRNLVRDLTRKVWIEEEGNQEEANRIVRETLRNGYGSIIGSILIGLAIKLAFELIKYWWDNRLSEPESVFTAGEPGVEDDE